MQKRKALLALALTLSLALAVPSCAPTEVDESIVAGEIGARVDEYLTRITPYGFSGAVLISDGGEIVLNKGYGLAIREGSVPNTANTVFTTGSITKQFTAAAIMTLEMAGLLDTSDPLSEHVDGVPEEKRAVTLHHLLTHTSGVIGGTGPDFVEAGRDETVRAILEAPLEFEPGTEMNYSNAGYSLLAAVVEEVSDRSYEEYVREHLFAPAGMERTGYRLPRWDRSTVAHWYVGETDNGTPLEKPYPQWNLLGNGGILSTTGDMHRWYLALQGTDVISVEAKGKLWTPALNDYAYGWDVIQGDRGMLVQHDGGSTLGASAEFRWFMGEDVLIVLFCNQTYAGRPLMSAVRDKIEALVFGGDVDVPPPTAAFDAEVLAEFAGKYRFENGGNLGVVFESGGLLARTYDQEVVNAFLFEGEAGPADYNDLNLRANALIAAAVRRDPAPFAREFPEGVAARVQSMFEGELASFEARTGEPALMAVALGTVPGFEEGLLMTGVRIRNRSGDTHEMSFVWHEGRVVGFDQLAYEVEIPLGPAAGDEFAGYHLVFGRPVKVTFTRGDDGAVNGLAVGEGDLARGAFRLHEHSDGCGHEDESEHEKEGERDDDGS
jgi:CubicO group peptidase (beta-lactamase class C family)